MDFSILKERRKALNLQQKQIADYVGVSPATVSRWENGDISSIKDQYLIKLSTILKISPNLVIGWDDPRIENDNETWESMYSVDDITDICLTSVSIGELRILSKDYGEWSADDKRLFKNMIKRFVIISKHPLDYQRRVYPAYLYQYSEETSDSGESSASAFMRR